MSESEAFPFSKEEIKDIRRGEYSDDIELIELDGWISEFKYQIATFYVKRDGKFFAIEYCRHGSYHTDYDYCDPLPKEVYEVEPIEVISKVWRRKEPQNDSL